MQGGWEAMRIAVAEMSAAAAAAAADAGAADAGVADAAAATRRAAEEATRRRVSRLGTLPAENGVGIKDIAGSKCLSNRDLRRWRDLRLTAKALMGG